ncbi:MAG: zinc-dependent metalloprotease family protein [Pseudomonadota bacterium]
MVRSFSFVIFVGLVLIASPAKANVTLSKYDLIDAPSIGDAAKPSRQGMTFAAAGRVWSLDLEPNTQLSEQLDGRATRLYKGRVAGNEESWLRVSERGGQLRGLLYDGQDFYALEPAADLGLAADTNAIAFYALKDIVVPANTMTCGHSAMLFGKARDLNVTAKAIASELEFVAEEVATQSIDIAVIGDSFFADGRSDPSGALLDRLNIIDGFFQDQVGVTLNVVETRITDAATEPFTTNEAGDLLDELADFKFQQNDLRPLGLVHLYTGRNLNGSTAGIAFRAALCSFRFGVALSEGVRNLTVDSLIGAHEFGHNFGAPHDNEAGSACESTPGGFLMSPSINGSSTFSACSLNLIQQEISTVSCLTSIQPIDVLPLLRGFPSQAQNGNAFQGRVDVTNNGSSAAGSVTLTVDSSAEAVLDTTSLPNGCSPALPTGASCTLPSLAAGASESFTFDFTAAVVGNAVIEATTVTTDDANASNDTASVNVAITAVVDTAAELAAPAQVGLGSDATVTATLRNLSNDPASNAEIVVTIPTELTVESVPAPCSENGGNVTCRQATLNGQSTFNFDIVVRGATLGSGTLTATASSDAFDPNTNNNSVQSPVEVIDPVFVDADLAVTVTGPNALETGDTATYFAEVSNAGPASADGVSLTVTLPAGLSISSTDNSDCTTNGNSVSCTFGTIASSANSRVGISTSAVSTTGGDIDATATASSPDPDSANNSTALAITISAATTTNPPPNNNDSGGGGGATGGLSLIALLALALGPFRRRRAASRRVG